MRTSRKQKPIGDLTALPHDQQELLREWLDTTTPYHEIAKRVLDEFAVKTDKDELSRMRKRFLAEEQEQSAAENLETIGELMDQGALANIQYKPVTLKLVEKRLFEHALDPNTDTKVLKNLYTIIDHHERRQLESRRLDLRQREVTLKETLAPQKMGRADACPATAVASSSPSSTSLDIADLRKMSIWKMTTEQKEAWFKHVSPVKTEEDIEKDWLTIGIDRKVFCEYLKDIPNPTGDDISAAQQAGKIAFQNRRVAPLQGSVAACEASAAATSSPGPHPDSSDSTLALAAAASVQSSISNQQPVHRSFSEGGSSTCPATAGISNQSSKFESSVRASQFRGGTHPCVPVSGASCPADPASIPSETSDSPESNTQPATASQSPIFNLSSVGHAKEDQQSSTYPATAGISNRTAKLESSVRDHLTRRALEWQRNGPNTRPTIYRECPCGKRTPCKDHGAFPEWFWQCSPWSGDLALAMLDRGLPYFDIKLQPEENT